MKITIRLVAIISVLFISTNLFAQKNKEFYSYSGTVFNASGQPLRGATIYISDLKKGAVAGPGGVFELKHIPAGAYLVEIHFVGYHNIIRNINFNHAVRDTLVMEIAVTEENEIVVTGVSRATSIKRNPVPIVTVNEAFLRKNLYGNIIDAIAKVPGISAVSTGPNVSKPFIRGLGFNRVLTLYDGVRMEGQQWGDEHGIEIDEHAVGKVEIIKGPASLSYGSDALAGVINMLPPEPPLPGHIKGKISSGYHTNNRQIENSLQFMGNSNSLSWGAILSHKRAIDYKNKIDGRVYNTGFRELDANLFGTLKKSWGYTGLHFSIFDDLQEIPDGARDAATRKFLKMVPDEANPGDPDYELEGKGVMATHEDLNAYRIGDVHQHVQHIKLYSNSKIILGEGRIGLGLGFQRSLRQEYAYPGLEVPALDMKLNTFTYNVKYTVAPGKRWEINTGITGMYQRNKVDDGTEFIIPPFLLFDIGPFLLIKKSYDKLTFSGGLRYDTRHVQHTALYVKEDPATLFNKVVHGTDTSGAEQLFDAGSYQYSGWSAAMGLTYNFDKNWSAKFNIARGYRAPNISEMTAHGVHPGSGLYQLGNPDLEPEFNWQQDLGITYQSAHVHIKMSVFNNTIQHYIFNRKLINTAGEDSVIVPGIPTFQFASSTANLHGGEFFIDIHPHPLDWLHFENSIAMVYAANKGSHGKPLQEGAKYLPNIPPLHTLSELQADFDWGNTIKHAFVKFQYEYTAPQNRYFAYNNTETATPGYGLVNVGIGTDIMSRKGNKIMYISVLANNIFNKAYQSHLSRLKYFEEYPDNFTGHRGIYNMGRNIGLSITIPVNVK